MGNSESRVFLLRTTSTQKYILNLPYVDVPSVNTSSRGTRAWRLSIIHTAATQRRRYCTSKHTRKRSPGTANCIKLHMQTPRRRPITAKPYTSLNGTFSVLCLSVHLSASSSAASAQKKQGTGEKRRGGWVSSCARSLRESVRHLKSGFSQGGNTKCNSDELCKWRIHVGVSVRLFSSVTHAIPKTVLPRSDNSSKLNSKSRRQSVLPLI